MKIKEWYSELIKPVKKTKQVEIIPTKKPIVLDKNKYVFIKNIKHNWKKYNKWDILELENSNFEILKSFAEIGK